MKCGVLRENEKRTRVGESGAKEKSCRLLGTAKMFYELREHVRRQKKVETRFQLMTKVGELKSDQE